MNEYVWAAIIFVWTILIMLLFSIKIIKPNECGVLILLGKPKRILYPGLNLVHPLMSSVKRIKTDSYDWEQQLNWYAQRFPEISDQIQSFKKRIKTSDTSAILEKEVICPKCGYRFRMN